MPKKTCPQDLKTRPDLSDRDWLIWLSEDPENAGIHVGSLYTRMLHWCKQKGLTPTRRRLLTWLDKEREEIPVTYTPGSERREPRETPAELLPDCRVCNNERFVEGILNPAAEFEWARKGMVPCTACSKEIPK